MPHAVGSDSMCTPLTLTGNGNGGTPAGGDIDSSQPRSVSPHCQHTVARQYCTT
jgi:hypothetical protein